VIAESRLADPALEGVVLSMRDISERKVLEDELRHQAFHDALTGLANRALFEDRLAHGLAGARRHGRPVAVLFLDLDDFKTINDSLGHGSGDDLLRAVAIRIAGIVRVTDTAARLGGDEFAILVDVMDDEDEAEEIAERLLGALTPPFVVGGRELRIRASIGVAHSDGSLGVDELLRNADTAMYAAKEAGKGRIETFQPGMHKRVLDRLELTGDMQRALERGEFELDYQPIVELCGCRIVGAEALVRWAHPTRGRLPPASFISLAEDTGLIVPLGEWILQTACRQAAAWNREFPDRGLYVTVNVSPRQLHHQGFPDAVHRAMVSSGLEPSALVLEITESLLPDDSDEIIERLRALKAIGVRVAVDDFGTGYSALSRLQAYPVDILKIDRSFIDGIDQDPSKVQLVRGILNLGTSLSMSVVAEGVEETGQAQELRGMRSALGQGYLFSRPSSPAEIRELIASNEPLAALGDPPADPDADAIAGAGAGDGPAAAGATAPVS
jgi:diguanylate cyclase (GGDEF)-like protein